MISKQYVDGLEIRNNESLNKIEQLQARCAELELERDALAVHVEHWKDISEQCAVAQTKVEACTIYEQANEHSTPQRSLAAHDAEVARKAYRQGFMDSGEGFNGELYQDGFSKVVSGYNQMEAEYIENIKEQAK